MKRIAVLGFIVAMLATLLLVQPAAAQEVGSRVHAGNDIVLGEDEQVVGDLVVVGGNVTVNGRVTGDVLAVGGWVAVTGDVGGNVTAIGNNVVLQPTAKVDGDAVSVGGQLQRAPGAQVRGNTSNVRVTPGLIPFLLFLAIAQAVVSLIILLLSAVISAAAFPGPAQAVERTISLAPWASLGVGFLVLVVFVFLAVPLVFTIVGLPLAILALIVASLFGLSALGALIGRRVLSDTSGYTAKAIVGVLILWIISIIPILGGLVLMIATWLAVGAVALSRFGTIRPPFSWQGPRSSPPAQTP